MTSRLGPEKSLTCFYSACLKVPSHQIRLVGIRFVDGKKIFKCCLHFFYSNLSCPSGIATCTALHAFSRFRRQYCSRSSNPDNTFSFSIFIIFLLFSDRGKELFHVTHMQTLMLHYLKGLLTPFCFRSKRYWIPFCSVQKVIRYRMQNWKNPRK